LEVSFWTLRAHISFKRVKIFKAHVWVLCLCHDRLSVDALTQGTVGKTMNGVSEEGSSGRLILHSSSW
jgi:hypothetical protein